MTQAAAILALRNFIGELETAVLPDTTTGSLTGALELLQQGAEQLNDDLGYFTKDSTITLVDGAESTLPTDFLEVVFVTLDGNLLHPTDIETLNTHVPNWRNAPKGTPEQFYIYSGKVGFYPVPDAAAVAMTTTMRHTAAPTISTTPGFDNLATQHHRIPVYFAAYLWLMAHGLDGDGHRAEWFLKLYERAAATVRPYYEKRKQERGPN